MSEPEMWIYPSDEETERVARQALAAAVEVLVKTLHPNDDPSAEDEVLAILRAFDAVENVRRVACEKHRETHKTGGSYDLDNQHIVASALITVRVFAGDEETHPYNVFGESLCAFEHACHLMRCQAELEGAQDLYFPGDRTDEVIALMESKVKAMKDAEREI